MRPSAFLFVVACLSLAPSLVTGQTPSTAPNNKYAAPYYLDCGRVPPYRSRSARTPILSSPDGQKEAYAEASARAQGEHCSNRSAVFVRQNGDAFELIFLQQPEEMLLGNGVRIIDWSKDGTKLLFDVLRWQYGSDAGPEDELWIYGASSGVLKRVPLNRIFRSFAGACYVSLEPLGFSEAGEVAMRVSAKQKRDVDGEIVPPKCEEGRGGWLYDPATNRLMQTSYEYAPPRWTQVRSR
jgi:hypothetical protein